MKHQAFFLRKVKLINKYIKVSSAAILLGALRVKIHSEGCSTLKLGDENNV